MVTQIEVNTKYNKYLISINSKGTALYLMLPENDSVLCKSWEGKRIDLAFKYLAKEIYI